MVRDKINAWAGSDLGILLIGQDEVTNEHALYAASLILGCPEDGLKNNPDLTIISSDKDLKVSDLEVISERIDNYARRSEKVVFLIRNIDRSSEGVPHKILKALEESRNAVFILTSGAGVLDTIKSRCLVVECRGNTDDLYSTDTESIALLGARGAMDGKLKAVLEEVRDAILLGEPGRLFTVLNMVMEKDKDSFAENKKEFPKLFNVIQFVLTDVLLYETNDRLGGMLEPQVSYPAGSIKDAITLTSREKTRLSISYTKDDLFLYLAKLNRLLS